MARKDWKKHLLRVKQIADQNLGRVEKTEALTADLQVLEKRVELFQKVYYSMGKKLQACVQGTGQEAEKRMKKLPEYSLSQTLIESSSLLSLDTLLGHIFQICGDAHGRVANNRLTNELAIESNVLVPIHTLLETSIPTIQKHKRALQKMVLDMDSAKTRFMSAQKQQQQGNTSSAKVDGLRDEYDEACYRVDQCRDQLATEMFTLASREAELSHILLELIKCQADFHRKALESLEKRIPQMEEQIEFWTHMPVYGKPLDDHLRRTERRIALVIEECVKNLCLLGGLEEEGLFRIAGAANKVKKLKAAFDSEQCSDIADEYDVHCIAGALKQYLRELPDPLMNSALYPQWMQAAHLPADQRVQALADVIAMLPKPNYDNLRYIIKFMQKLSESQEINKMSPSNIAIVLGPNLIWPEGEVGPNVLTTSTQSAIVETLISNCDYFFPGDLDFEKPSKEQIDAAPVITVSPDIKRDKCIVGNSDLGKRYGVRAGLSMAHQSLVSPSNNTSQSDASPTKPDNDKVTIRVDDADPAAGREDCGSLGSSSGSLGYYPRPLGSSRSGSPSDADSNGRYTKGLSNGDGFDYSSGSAPAHKGPPPCGLHSDVYNTVFALQSLGDGWSDYLTRVRTLWDGHMSQRSSVVGPNGSTENIDANAATAPPSGEKGAHADDDILEQVMASAPSPVVAMATPDLISSTAGEVGPGSPSPPPASVSVRTSTTPDLAQHGHPAQNLIGAVHGPGLSVSPTGSLENMAASTGSLTHADHGYSHGSVSPKPPRRDKKKPAPLPPGERPLGPAPPPPSKPSDVAALPYPVKPPLPDRPTDPATRGDGRPHSPGARSRSVGEKPEKPAKPDKPPEKLYPTLPRTRPASDSAQPARDASPPQPHRDLDKPPVPPPPTPDTPGHRRSGSSGARPPRPTPPPPPAHKPAALPEEAAPQGKSDEQTYL